MNDDYISTEGYAQYVCRRYMHVVERFTIIIYIELCEYGLTWCN